jgi:hypothetical protein
MKPAMSKAGFINPSVVTGVVLCITWPGTIAALIAPWMTRETNSSSALG